MWVTSSYLCISNKSGNFWASGKHTKISIAAEQIFDLILAKPLNLFRQSLHFKHSYLF